MAKEDKHKGVINMRVCRPDHPSTGHSLKEHLQADRQKALSARQRAGSATDDTNRQHLPWGWTWLLDDVILPEKGLGVRGGRADR